MTIKDKKVYICGGFFSLNFLRIVVLSLTDPALHWWITLSRKLYTELFPFMKVMAPVLQLNTEKIVKVWWPDIVKHLKVVVNILQYK
jgi:hypothetical protein